MTTEISDNEINIIRDKILLFLNKSGTSQFTIWLHSSIYNKVKDRVDWKNIKIRTYLGDFQGTWEESCAYVTLSRKWGNECWIHLDFTNSFDLRELGYPNLNLYNLIVKESYNEI